jgi:hypothetical protein
MNDNVGIIATRDIGELAVVVFNVGAWYNESILTISAQKFSKVLYSVPLVCIHTITDE